MCRRIDFYLLLCISSFCVCACGGRPQTPVPPDVSLAADDSLIASLPNCSVNVYIENSASMDGYVKSGTEFEESLYSYLNEIKRAVFCENLSLNYINSKILPQPDNVRDFIYDLEPSSFRAKGGNRSTTDISDLFQKIMEEQGEDDIAILVSDFVFSPGHQDAAVFLGLQQIAITDHFANRLKIHPDYSAVLYRLVSKFEGKYYNKNDRPVQIAADRPFFIWLLGNRDQLHRLTSMIKKDNVKGRGVDHEYSLSKMSSVIPYGILPMPRIGSFQMVPGVKNAVSKAKLDRKATGSKFVISFGVDYSGFLLEDSYLTDPDNYEVSNKAYSIEVGRNTSPASSYTHVIKLMLDPSQPVISRGNIKVSLLRKSAPWVEEFTDTIGEDINADGAMEKTFGLKTLVDGVFDAYKDDSKYASFTININ